MRRLLYIFALVTIFASCTDDTQGGAPQLELFIEDSPADFQSVNIVIETIELFGNQKWDKLNYGSSPIPILEYTGGSSLRLVNQPLAQGAYSKIRFTFAPKGNNLTLKRGASELTIKESQRVVELPLDITATSGTSYVMCDMDVAASIDTVAMILDPKLSIINLNTAGAISGVISTTEGVKIAERMWIECIANGKSVKSSFTNQGTGKFFVRLDAGDYTIVLTPSKSSVYLPDTLRNVKVEQAKATMIGAVQFKSKTPTPTPTNQ